MKKVLLAAVAAAAVLGGSAANAAITVSATDNGNDVTLTTAGGALGNLSFTNDPLGLNALLGGVIISGSAQGFPLLAQPTFNENTMSLSAYNLSTAHTIVITLTQTGLTSPTSVFDTSNTINGLIGNVTSASAVSSINSTQISSLSTFGSGNSFANEQVASANHGQTYSETTVYTILFGANPNARSGATLSTQIGAGAVPEAATWAMMLVGFGAVGGALRTSRRKVSFA